MPNFPLRSTTGKSRNGSRMTVAVVKTGRFGLDTDARREADRIELTLPNAPSSNNLFGNNAGGGRYRTQEYDDWIEEAGWRLLEQRPGRISGPYEIELKVPRPSGNRRADLDNRGVKAISDLLVRHRVVADDSLAERLTVSWLPPGSGAVVILTRAEARS